MARNEKTILGYEMLDRKKIKRSAVKRAVRKKLKEKDEVVIMKTSRMKKLAIAGAVIGTALLSFTTVNAATGGALGNKVSETFSKVRIIINGEEVETDAVVTKYEDGNVIVYGITDYCDSDGETPVQEIEIEDERYNVDSGDVAISIQEYDGDVNLEVGKEISPDDVIYDPEKGDAVIIDSEK